MPLNHSFSNPGWFQQIISVVLGVRKSQGKIFILMPTYNHRKFLQAAVEGVMSQVVDLPFLLIIRDDASTDGTSELAEQLARRFDGRIKLILNERNRYRTNTGAVAEMLREILHKKGMFAAKSWLCRLRTKQTAFIALCEGDDFWTDPQKLQKQVNVFRRNKLARLVHHDIDIRVETNGSKDYETAIRNHLDNFDSRYTQRNKDQAAYENHIMTCTVMFRASAVDDWVLMGRPPGLAGDMVLFALISRQSHIHFIDSRMATYRIHGDSVWSPMSEEYRAKVTSATKEYLNSIRIARGEKGKAFWPLSSNSTYSTKMLSAHLSQNYPWGPLVLNFIIQKLSTMQQKNIKAPVNGIISDEDEMYHRTGEEPGHYYRVGYEVAEILAENYHAKLNSHNMAILHLGSGFGRGTRFIKAFLPDAKLWSSDHLESANVFCAENFDCTTFPSPANYRSTVVSQKFDVIWAESLVTNLSELETRDLLIFLRDSLKPNGKIIISSNGSLVYERLKNDHKYGLGTVDSSSWSGYNETGYSHKNYPKEGPNGISVISKKWWNNNMAELGLELENYQERRWDNHHDVVVLVQSKKVDIISKIKSLFKVSKT